MMRIGNNKLEAKGVKAIKAAMAQSKQLTKVDLRIELWMAMHFLRRE